MEIPIDPRNWAWMVETCSSRAFSYRPRDLRITPYGAVFLKIQCMTEEQAEAFDPESSGLALQFLSPLPQELQEALGEDLIEELMDDTAEAPQADE